MADAPKSRVGDPKVAPAEDKGFGGRKLPGTPAGEAKGILPGMALIGMYLLVLAMLNAFAAARGAFGAGGAKYTILAICTLLVVGVFGMLRLLRWGWAIVTAGCVVMVAGYFYGYSRAHILPYIVQGLFALVFFLYLSRTEVRERLR
jgi:nicotinamide riboside transporter PnuC